MEGKPDVIVVGGGIAAIAAASKLGQSGRSVLLLEARNRLGGRILTKRDPNTGAAIELGAEFIHGFVPEVWNPLRASKAQITEVEGESWCANGQLLPCRFFNDVEKILDKMKEDEADQSFLQFLEHACPPPLDARQQAAKKKALNFITGFNAADPTLVGVHWLVKGMRAEQLVDGQRAFRSRNGYEDLLDFFRRELGNSNIFIRTDTIVDRVAWSPGTATVTARHPHGSNTFTAPRVLITLPLSILKASSGPLGSVQFAPSLPKEKQSALDRLEMGKVIRLVLKFRTPFWKTISPRNDNRTLKNLSFLFSDDAWFPTWWTAMPADLPLVTGWAPFQCAEALSGRDETFVIERGLTSLSSLLNVSKEKMESMLDSAYIHDWQSDPFSLGAYSYGKVQSDGAQEALAAPLENTLFFAGEATDVSGHNGTVHGAIASGYRAARDILGRR